MCVWGGGGGGGASIMPNLMLSSMRHMRPKSRMASRPSGVRMRFPGCGSACRAPPPPPAHRYLARGPGVSLEVSVWSHHSKAIQAIDVGGKVISSHIALRRPWLGSCTADK